MPRGLQLAYREVEFREGSSPNEAFAMDQQGATRILDVDWLTRGTAIQQLLGYPRIDTSGATNTLRRYLPDIHPEFPDLVATSVSSKGIGVRGAGTGTNVTTQTINGRKVNVYANARLTVQYTFPEYDLKEDDEITTEFDRYTTLNVQGAAEYLTVPLAGTMKFSEGTSELFPGNVGYIIGSEDLIYKWWQIPFATATRTTCQNLIGRVNKTTFDGCAPHTLLMISYEIERVCGPNGRTKNFTFVFRRNRRGHNKIFHPRDKVFAQVSTDGSFQTPGSATDGKLIFDEGEFGLLWDVVGH